MTMGAATEILREAGSVTGERERRAKERYPIEFEVRYRTLAKMRRRMSGVGRTVNISSMGVLVSVQDEIAPGTSVELRMDWPFRISDAIGLQLVIKGRVIRRQQSTLGIEFKRYEFWTKKI